MNDKESKWVCTDDACSQYRKIIDENTFMFIEYTLLPNGVCEVFLSTIDLNDFLQVEIIDCISSYYKDLTELKTIYGNESNAIMAECIFEQRNWVYYDETWEFEDEEKARAFIEEKIKTI